MTKAPATAAGRAKSRSFIHQTDAKATPANPTAAKSHQRSSPSSPFPKRNSPLGQTPKASGTGTA